MGWEATPEEIKLFFDETDEQLLVLESGLLALEANPGDRETMAGIFRAAHTIKGGAATLEFDDMARVTHALENILDLLRSGACAVSPELLGTLLETVDFLRRLREEAAAGRVGETDAGPMIARLRTWEAACRTGTASESAPAATGNAGTGDLDGAGWHVRAVLAPDTPMPSVRALQVMLALERAGQIVSSQPSAADIEADRVGGQIEVMLDADVDERAIRELLGGVPDLVEVTVERVESGHSTASQAAAPPPPAAPLPGAPPSPSPAAAAPRAPGAASGSPPGAPAADGRAPDGASRTIRVDVSLLDRFMNLVSELVIDRTKLNLLVSRLEAGTDPGDAVQQLALTAGHIGRITNSLQDEVMRARMLPIDVLFKKLPRMVRDLAVKCGKQIDFAIFGEDTQVDRSVVEVLGDPLIHLLRNALDHGIEGPDARVRAGKPPVGRIELTAKNEENQIVITVSDDGAGIDPARIRRVAVQRGVIDEERARSLSDVETLELIFAPGFSTAKTVSEVSGRGVGMEVVRKSVDRLNGTVQVESQVGRGSTFTVRLPLTLATMQALLLRVAGQVFAIPLSSVVSTLHLQSSEVASLTGRKALRLRDQVVPLIDAATTMRLRSGEEREQRYCVVVRTAGRRYALCVDDLIGGQEVVVKGLGSYLGDVIGVSGATILGDGTIALIIDVASLVHQAA